MNDLIRKSTIMTERGPAVLLSSVHSAKGTDAPFSESDDDDDEDEAAAGRAKKEEPRSPIAQMLYARWVLNLREQREFRVAGVAAPQADLAIVRSRHLSLSTSASYSSRTLVSSYIMYHSTPESVLPLLPVPRDDTLHDAHDLDEPLFLFPAVPETWYSYATTFIYPIRPAQRDTLERIGGVASHAECEFRGSRGQLERYAS